MTCNRYHLWAALDVHAFSKAEAVLRFSAEEDGMWVQWQDYASLKAELTDRKDEADRLKAEVERLRASSFVTAVPVEQYERVVKAGDAMHKVIGYELRTDRHIYAWHEWNAAKEGKQTK